MNFEPNNVLLIGDTGLIGTNFVRLSLGSARPGRLVVEIVSSLCGLVHEVLEYSVHLRVSGTTHRKFERVVDLIMLVHDRCGHDRSYTITPKLTERLEMRPPAS